MEKKEKERLHVSISQSVVCGQGTLKDFRRYAAILVYLFLCYTMHKAIASPENLFNLILCFKLHLLLTYLLTVTITNIVNMPKHYLHTRDI